MVLKNKSLGAEKKRKAIKQNSVCIFKDAFREVNVILRKRQELCGPRS